MSEVLSQRELDAMHAYWRAANYLSVGQIYLYDNPLLEKPLSKEHIKASGSSRVKTYGNVEHAILQPLVDWGLYQ